MTSDVEPRFGNATAMLFAFLQTAALKTAVDLGLFTHIAHGHRSAAAIARAAAADARGVAIVLDALAAHGLLTKSGDEYGLTPTAELILVKDSPAYMGDFTRITANPLVWSAVGGLTDVVRTGKPRAAMIDTPDHDFWIEFSEASLAASALPAATLAGALGLDPDRPLAALDVACGSGAYGFALLDQYPKARVTALDWPAVLERTRRFADARGVAERVTWLAGSVFDAPLPAAHFDVVIASHFYHHFSIDENVALSRRLYAALKPGGLLAVHDWVPDEARVAHQPALMFAIVMLATTERGNVYTLPEYRATLERAGFRDLRTHEVPQVGSQVMIARRPA